MCWSSTQPSAQRFVGRKDLFSACFDVIQKYDHHEIINISSVVDYPIKEVARMVKEIVVFQEEILWDVTQPNGTMKRPLNINKIKKMGCFHRVNLYGGIFATFEWYKQQS